MSSRNSGVGRNDPCPCGSGRKFKKCCIGKQDAADQDLVTKLPPLLRFLEECFDDYSQDVLSEYHLDSSCIHLADYWSCAGQAASINRKHHDAIGCYERALKLNPKNHSFRVNLAVNVAAAGESERALTLLSEVPDRTHRKEVVSANILQDLGCHEEATKNYEMAIEDEPDFFLAYARILTSLRATQSSLLEYWLNTGQQALPDSAEIGYAYCLHLFADSRFEDLAEAHWIDDLKSDSGRRDMVGMSSDDESLIFECHMFRDIARIHLNDDRELLAEALHQLDRVEGTRGACDIGRSLAILSAQLGVPDGVDQGLAHVCDKCLVDRERIEGPPELFHGYAQAALGDHEKAVGLCESVLDVEPNNRSALWQCWWSMDEVGRIADAIAIAERLLAIDPAAPSIQYNLGYLCGKHGLLGKAKYYYQEQLKAWPGHREAVENLGFIHLLSGELKSAEQCMAQFCDLFREELESELENTLQDTSEAGNFDQIPVFEDGRCLAEFLDAKQETFQKLRDRAAATQGSDSYVMDLLKENNDSNPVFGSCAGLKPCFSPMGNIVGAINAAHGARVEEVKFEFGMRSRGDVSHVIAAIEQEIPKWGTLPEYARAALKESEKRFMEGNSADHAPDILGYAKCVEITLDQLVFEGFRAQGVGFQARQEVEAVLAQGSKKQRTVRLASFVDKGAKLELGSMAFVLSLCTGRTAKRSPLIGALKNFVLHIAPGLLSAESLESLQTLASEYRNPAAHERSFCKETAGKARDIAYQLLATLLVA